MKFRTLTFLIILTSVFCAEVDTTTTKIRPVRLGLASAFSVGAVAYASGEFTRVWGESSSSTWGWKTGDWNGDGLVQTDEFSHFQLGQRITEFGYGMSRWCGFRHNTSLWIGASIGLAGTFWVEIIDAYNPDQGFGVTDMVVDVAGVLFALLRKQSPFVDRFDLRVTFEDLKYIPDNLFMATDFRGYDNAIFWITYQPDKDLPFDVCLGYSSDRDYPSKVPRRELFIGAGISGEKLIGLFDSDLARQIGTFAEWYEITLYARVYRGPEVPQDDPH